jgi:hypothetical protein
VNYHILDDERRLKTAVARWWSSRTPGQKTAWRWWIRKSVQLGEQR